MKTETNEWIDVTEGRRGFQEHDRPHLPRQRYGYASEGDAIDAMASNRVAFRIYRNRFGKFDLGILGTYYRLKRSARSGFWITDASCLASCLADAVAELGDWSETHRTVSDDEWVRIQSMQHLKMTGLR